MSVKSKKAAVPPVNVVDTTDDDGGSDSSDSQETEEKRLIIMRKSEMAMKDVRTQLKEIKAVFRSVTQRLFALLLKLLNFNLSNGFIYRNNEIPEKFRIKAADLKLPNEIYEHIYKTIEKDCDEVYRVHEYESAETIIQLDKIMRFYFENVETPHIVVKDVSHELQVHTIRSKKPSPIFQELISKNKEVIEEEKRILLEQTVMTEAEIKVELPPIKRTYANEIIGEYESKMDTFDVETVHNIRHLERRLLQKYENECAVS
jgi:hypothetical protein